MLQKGIKHEIYRACFLIYQRSGKKNISADILNYLYYVFMNRAATLAVSVASRSRCNHSACKHTEARQKGLNHAKYSLKLTARAQISKP